MELCYNLYGLSCRQTRTSFWFCSFYLLNQSFYFSASGPPTFQFCLLFPKSYTQNKATNKEISKKKKKISSLHITVAMSPSACCGPHPPLPFNGGGGVQSLTAVDLSLTVMGRLLAFPHGGGAGFGMVYLFDLPFTSSSSREAVGS